MELRIPDRYGQTSLHIAAKQNRAGLCIWLLLGANVNRTNILDRTALHYAVRHDAADVTRLLMAHGANLEAKDRNRRTPLDLAEADGSDAVARVICEEISIRHAHTAKALRLAQDG